LPDLQRIDGGTNRKARRARWIVVLGLPEVSQLPRDESNLIASYLERSAKA
jgi:hypothetical protein